MPRKPQPTITPTPSVPYDHAYTTCRNCHGSGLASGNWWTPNLTPCEKCRSRYESSVKRLGPAKAEAERRILAIEWSLLNDHTMPKEIIRRQRKPLSTAGATWVADYHTSDLNREYLRNLKTWWA